ncbi:CCAAT-binding factor subunit A (HAP3) protein [Dioscorea alata]|uniref:CCAAT-binding factor subunit A (HAP3) protein n=1 Tax=Dioscorea alata TaxID=55571 RepID=A0ACB7VJP9_DIOAL|nr:CCAAT-binding factor subunit A (HAP3) protein [Dioscorea alata]
MDSAALFQGFQRISRSKSDVGTLSPASITTNTPANPNGSLDHSPSLTDANPNPNSTFSGDANNNNNCMVREQDRFMPIANVIRIMRKVLPTHAKISDEAKETIQECVSEYISFITSEANDRCQREQRKTITAEDIIWAMSKLGFDDYIEPLSVYLQRYRELEGDHRGAVRGDALPLKRSQSDVGGGGGGYGAPPPYSLGQGYHGYGGGYYMGVYGDGSGGSSPQGGGGGGGGGGGAMGGGGGGGYESYGPYN